MKYLIGIPLLLFAAAAQATVLAEFNFFGGNVNLVLLITLSWTLMGEWQGGAVWGVVGGLALDLLSGGPLGLSALGLMVVAFIASLSEGQLWRSHVLLPLAVALFGSVGFHLIYLLGLNALGYPVPLGLGLWQVTLPSVLINTLLILPVYTGIRWLHSVVEPPVVKV